MVKPLTFKGDKPKKRKREADPDAPKRTKTPKPTPTVDNADDAAAADEDDRWVSVDAVTDVAGPILVVLPASPPAALACDANGSVFAMPVENMVDGNPASAEPHDVRQVWVASRVAGADHLQLKGSHGRYLGCDASGNLSATAPAVSPLESFVLTDAPEKFGLKTLRGTFVGVVDGAVRGDLSSADTLRLRMQARFKPRLQQSKADKARERISRRELEDAAGRRLDEDEVRRLKRARREGDYHEQLLILKAKSKHDRFG